MIYFQLLCEFFRIGLLSFGGGYATIPFLYHISESYHWYSVNELTKMIAVASITPGPVGINMATYTGLKISGITGAAAATAAEILPSFIMVIVISKLLKKYQENFYVKSLIECLKPIGCALLAFVTIGLLKPYIHDIKALIILGVLILLSLKSKKDTLFYILIAGIAGVCLQAL